jgi:hypothetical protein
MVSLLGSCAAFILAAWSLVNGQNAVGPGQLFWFVLVAFLLLSAVIFAARAALKGRRLLHRKWQHFQNRKQQVTYWYREGPYA